MKFFFVLGVFAMAVAVIQGFTDEEHWRAFKAKYKLNYKIASDGGKVDRMRKKLFLEEKAKLRQQNAKLPDSFLKELNAFSVMKPEEKKRFLGIKPALIPSAQFMKTVKNEFRSNETAPLSLDYRFSPCLTEVRTQGLCGSCWAFSAVTPLEFSRCRNGNKTVVLSEQQLVDCDAANNGCNGGWYVTAWSHLQQQGSAKRTLYPYNAKKNVCTYNTSMVEATVSNFGYVQSQNATAMQLALQEYGPLAVAMTVINSFYSYADGVYDDPACDGKDVNHGVVVVGWGVLNGVDFWIVRNSWGTNWGIQGYARVQRGVNKCNIELYPAFAVAY